MREDFKHLLTERERYNSRWDQAKGNKKALQKDMSGDYDTWASGGKIAIGKDHLGHNRRSKSLNENLSPLSKFLRGSVGKKWDDVYSEICQVCPKDSAVNAHIFQHLEHYVLTSPMFKDGEVYSLFFSYTPIYSTESGFRGYVDESGILREANRKPKSHFSTSKGGLRSKLERRISPTLWLAKLNKIWHEVTLAPIPYRFEETGQGYFRTSMRINEGFQDLYLIANGSPFYLMNVNNPGVMQELQAARTISEHGKIEIRRAIGYYCQQYYGADVYCNSLKPLDKETLRKYNLKNG